MQIHEKLKMLLKQKGRGSQAKLAKMLGEDTGFVSRWVSGKQPIPRNKLKAVANFLGVTVDYLLDDSQEKPAIRLVPLIGKASCGVPSDHFYDENYEYVEAPFDIDPEGVYAVEAFGDSMHPKIEDGETVLCDTKRPIHSGDIVHYTFDGESGIKKIIKNPDGSVTLMPLNEDCPDCNPIFIPKERANDLHAVKCVRVYKVL